MNIKKSPLVAGLLALNSIFGAMTGKAEAPKYSLTNEDMGNIFTNQTEVSSFQVNGVDVHVMTGWQHKQVWIEGSEAKERTLTAPFIVSKDGAAFSGAFADMPTNISTVAINEDNGRVYAFKSGTNREFYEMNLGKDNVTASEPLKVLNQLSPSVTNTLGFHSENDENSNRRDTKVDRAVVWTDSNQGEFILTYDLNGDEESPSTTIWHRNGVVNRVAQFTSIEPVDVLKGNDIIYYGNMADNQLVAISKANPTNGVESVTLHSDNVGVGVVSNALYQAKANGIYDQNGQQLAMECKFTNGQMSVWVPQQQWETQIEIKDMTTSYDKSGLVIACDPNESKDTLDLRLSNGTSIVAVKGATKVESRQDGIYALIQNQMQKVR